MKTEKTKPCSCAVKVKRNSVQKPKTPRGYVMQRFCKSCNGLMEDNVPISTFEGLIRAWIHQKNGNVTVVDSYRISPDGNKLYFYGRGRNLGFGEDVLAIKLKDGRIIGNASKLSRCGSYRKGVEAPAQRVMFAMNMVLVPFNVFTEADFKLDDLMVVKKGREEDFMLPKLVWDSNDGMLRPVSVRNSRWFEKRPKRIKGGIILKTYPQQRGTYPPKKDGKSVWTEIMGWNCTYVDRSRLAKRHFVGAMILELGGKHYLFDVDRRELKFYRFNPFLSELPHKVKSIAEAYESLKPPLVVKALKQKKKVLRQGEWFFIPLSDDRIPKIPSRPEEIKKGLLIKPQLEHFDLRQHWYSAFVEPSTTLTHSLIDLDKLRERLKSCDTKPEYHESILQRAEAFNKERAVYNGFAKQREDFERKFMHYPRGGEIKAQNNRPNRVGELMVCEGVYYAKGEVTHTGRQHEPLTLKSWHLAVPNTAIKSFTITGNID